MIERVTKLTPNTRHMKALPGAATGSRFITSKTLSFGQELFAEGLPRHG